MNISPDSVPYGVCAEWKDKRYWAVLLQAEEEEQKQMSAASQQIEEEEERNLEGRNCKG